MDFKLHSLYQPTGDQPQAIDSLVDGLQKGEKHQVLLGATGTGKTFTIANVVARVQRPTLVIAHNKTLAAQDYAEFRDFFPENAVEYFVSYYDYYQPEAYVPRQDLYIEKETETNAEIERLRLAATTALLSRRDVLIVASVSCIYGLGSPEAYGKVVINLEKGKSYRRTALLRQLVETHYERNDTELKLGAFRVRGDTLEVMPAYAESIYRLSFFGDELERITELHPVTGEILSEPETVSIYPARHYIAEGETLKAAIADVEAEAAAQVEYFKTHEKPLEAERIEQRTRYDIEMLREVGYCSGIENYSRHMDRRAPGSPPWVLLDYFPPDFLLVMDESHMSIPQVRGMSSGDRSRKQTLVDYGFRLPSALDNRPLTFEEFEGHVGQTIYTSATPGPYEMQRANRVVQQIIRPTGILDPELEVRPALGQVDDLLAEIRARLERGERTLVTTLTKRMAEDLAEYLAELGIKVHYLHSEVLDDRASRDPARPAAGQIRRGGGDQPPARGLGPAGSLAGGDPRRGQGRLPALRHLADPDDRPGGAPRAGQGDHVRRQDHRLDAARDRRNQPPAQDPDGLQHRARDRAGQHHQGGARPDRAAARFGAGRRRRRRRVSGLSRAEAERVAKDLEREMRTAAQNLEFEKAAALRDQLFELRGFLENEKVSRGKKSDHRPSTVDHR